MFYYIEGTVSDIDAHLAVIDCGGVGFACHTTNTTLAQIKQGERARLYTYCNIKEDSFDIYGFFDKGEKRCFELLISVSGVGPKAALSILSVCSPENLVLSILAEDEKAITMAQGVGKKLAQRVILELKDKMGGDLSGYTAASASASASGFVRNVPGGSTNISDATAALLVLGYSRGEISAAMRSINTEEHTVEEIVRLALKSMANTNSN